MPGIVITNKGLVKKIFLNGQEVKQVYCNGQLIFNVAGFLAPTITKLVGTGYAKITFNVKNPNSEPLYPLCIYEIHKTNGQIIEYSSVTIQLTSFKKIDPNSEVECYINDDRIDIGDTVYIKVQLGIYWSHVVGENDNQYSPFTEPYKVIVEDSSTSTSGYSLNAKSISNEGNFTLYKVEEIK